MYAYLAPHSLVKLHINTNILGFHHFLSKLLNFLDGARGALLESNSMKFLVQVDSIFSRHDGLASVVLGHLQ